MAIHTFLWNERPHISERVVLLILAESITFLKYKTKEWDLKSLLFNYWNDLVLSSVKTRFLEVGAYVFLKWLTADL